MDLSNDMRARQLAERLSDSNEKFIIACTVFAWNMLALEVTIKGHDLELGKMMLTITPAQVLAYVTADLLESINDEELYSASAQAARIEAAVRRLLEERAA